MDILTSYGHIRSSESLQYITEFGVAAEMLIHLKLELLTQFPVSNEQEHLAYLKNDLISLKPSGFRTGIFMETFFKITVYFFICHPLQAIFIHY